MTENNSRKRQVIDFLNSIRRPGPALGAGDDHTPLIRSGFIDSLGVLEIIAFLERDFGLKFAARGINPGELETVANILDLIEAETTRRERVREG
jgi:acyl carrier protein